jgi:hypothetical protein
MVLLPLVENDVDKQDGRTFVVAEAAKSAAVTSYGFLVVDRAAVT